jgi:nicotinate phosphoribosyltransferase
MAHSFVQSYDDEAAAFEAYAVSRPNNLTLLIDTYDTEAAARKVVALAPRLKAKGITIGAVRLDSGDLAVLSRAVRGILDNGGFPEIKIFVSGGLDENSVAALLHAGAPIDGFGIGTSLTTSSDAPTLDCVYKLEEYAGVPRRKRSIGKETWPGRKQVWRRLGADGRMAGDVLSLESDRQDGEPLLELVMQDGRRLTSSPSLAECRARAARELARLPEPLRALGPQAPYPVEVAIALVRLANEVDTRLARDGTPA